MYAIIKQDGSICEFDTRDIPVEQLAPLENQRLFIQIEEQSGLKIGDIWNPDTQTWTIVDLPAPIEPIPTEPTPTITISDIMVELEAMKVGMKATGVLPKDFVQPTGAHDAYKIGDKVVYQGIIYESTIDANVWSPTDYPQGWKTI